MEPERAFVLVILARTVSASIMAALLYRSLAPAPVEGSNAGMHPVPGIGEIRMNYVAGCFILTKCMRRWPGSGCLI